MVNALSESLEVEIKRYGKVYTQEYRRGEPITPLRESGCVETSGTRVTFKPDPLIFEVLGIQLRRAFPAAAGIAF